MPPKGAKRGRPTAEAARKKAKLAEAEDPVILQCAGLAEGLKMAELPDSCHDMFMAMMPRSLAVAKDKRHKSQDEVVGMLEEIFKGIEAKLEQVVADGQALKDSAAADTQAKHAEKQRLLDSLNAQLNEIAALKTTRQGCINDTKTAVSALEDAQEAQKTSAAQVDEAAGLKTKCETTVTETLRKVTAGEWGTKSEAKKMSKELEDIGKKLSFEPSLVNGIPAATEKKPDDRGSFDKTVLEQYDKMLKEGIVMLGQRSASAETLAAEHAAAVSAAEGVLAEKRTQEATAKANVEAAEQAAESTKGELEDAKKAEKACGPATKEAHVVHKGAELDLDHFQEKFLAPFEALKDRETPAEEAPPAEAVAEAEAEVEAEEE